MKNFFTLSVLVGLVLYFTGCSSPVSPETDGSVPESVEVTGVVLTESAITVGTTRTVQLDAVSVLPSDASNQSVLWSSSDDTVATVSSAGLVTGIGVGSAVITVTTEDGEFQDTLNVTVETYVPIAGIFLAGDDSFQENETEPIAVVISPANATNKSFSASIDNSSIMEISLEGDNFVNITGLNSGTATLTITSDDDDTISESFTITISDDVTSPLLEDILILDGETVYVSFSEEVDDVQLETLANYSIIKDPSGAAISIGITSIDLVSLSPKSIVYLNFSSALSIGDEIELTVNGISDLSGNTIVSNGSDNVSESTYVPSHDLNVNLAQVSEANGSLSLTAGGVAIASAPANFNPDSFQVFAVNSGNILAQNTVIAGGNVASDGSTAVFFDLMTGDDVIFANGSYDLYVKGDYDIDGDFISTTDDQYFSFEGPVVYTVTTGL